MKEKDSGEVNERETTKKKKMRENQRHRLEATVESLIEGHEQGERAVQCYISTWRFLKPTKRITHERPFNRDRGQRVGQIIKVKQIRKHKKPADGQARSCCH